MFRVLPEVSELTLPTNNNISLAKESSEKLSKFVCEGKNLRFQILDEENNQEQVISIPSSVVNLLLDVLRETAKGNAITLIPIQAELTTQEAADLLNVSRPFLVKLLDEKKIPYRKVGTHRRVLFKDLMEYKKNSRIESLQSLAELAAQAQELDMGY